jgi:L-lactate dehydrogenase complex protein LldE
VFAPYDAVVAPSGSCVAMVRNHFAELVPERRDEVDALAARTFELSEYLVDVLGVDDIGARIDAPVTVHDACHGLRGLRVADAPRTLLRRAGATIVEMTEADTCCGFGGVFSLGYPEVSTRLADAKLDHARTTETRWLVSTDLACLMHLDGRRRRTRDPGPQAVHLADFLASGLPA